MTHTTLYPCTIKHTRVWPKLHSFSYSYLLVGSFIRWEGRDYTKEITLSGTGWYVNHQDYLERDASQKLGQKVDNFLQDQGLQGADYPYVYLLTAPKLLGYSFSPISFWYLYSTERALTALILEVNNTFDERHMYLLRPSPTEDENDQVAPKKSTLEWPKEFYVSPFNSVDGRYSICTVDPLDTTSSTKPIHSRITLASSQGKTLLVASIRSTQPAIDVNTLQRSQRYRLLLSWWWVGFMTFPRILFEALKLYLLRNLPIQKRPLPRPNSIGRPPSDTERFFESVFRRYMAHLVQNANLPITVRYNSAGYSVKGSAALVIASSTQHASAHETTILEIRVCSPAFYTYFAQSRCTSSDDVLQLLEHTDLISVSGNGLFHLLIREGVDKKSQISLALSDRLLFYTAYWMRKWPLEDSPPQPNGPFISELDRFVLTSCPSPEQTEYRKQLLKLLLINRFALGSLALLRLECLALFWVFVRVWNCIGPYLLAENE